MAELWPHLALFTAVCAATWFAILFYWPRLLLGVYKRAVLSKGFGAGPVPINTLYTERAEVFADPLGDPLPKGASNLMRVGVNRDTLPTCAWLDLRTGPLVLHVPDMAGRYYSIQFTDPRKNVAFAYVGKRVTGTRAGDFLITGPGWAGTVPDGMGRIDCPTASVMLLGRTFVADDADIATAHRLASQIRLAPLDAWTPER